MKQEINGKMYDTETAKHLATEFTDYPRKANHHWCEKLYVKADGEFFAILIGLSPSGHLLPDDVHFHPFNEHAAQWWVRQSLSADEYEAIFGLENGGAR